jgi:nucleotide-binding universal stress UspA family protein
VQIMTRTVTVGLDGSAESRAAADWAAREAESRGLPLKIIHVWEPVPDPMAQAPLLGPETPQHWTERSETGVPPAEGWGSIPRESAEGLRLRHPGIEVISEQLSGSPGEVLVEASKTASLLVLGSRALGGVGGFLVGSVGLSVVAHAESPEALVRAGEQAADEHQRDPAGIPSTATPFRPVVLVLDIDHPDETLIEFAFDAALRRATSLRVLHAWFPPPYYAYGMPVNPPLYEALALERFQALAEVLSPWRLKYPDVETTEESPYGGAAEQLVEASREAGAQVAAIDVTDEKLELATAFGADLVIDARKDDVGEVLRQHGGAHAAIAPAVNDAAFEAVNSALRRGGKLVMVALPAHGTVRVPIFDTVLNGTSVIGSIVGTRQDLTEVFQLHAAGQTQVICETRPPASVNESIDEVLRGQVKARIVFDLDAGR